MICHPLGTVSSSPQVDKEPEMIEQCDDECSTIAAQLLQGPLDSALRGGGVGGQQTRARKRQEQQLFEGLQLLLQQHCGSQPPPASMQPAPSGKRPSKTKRKQQQRHVEAAQGLLGSLQKLVHRASTNGDGAQTLLERLQSLVTAACAGKLPEPKTRAHPNGRAPIGTHAPTEATRKSSPARTQNQPAGKGAVMKGSAQQRSEQNSARDG